MLTDLAQVLRSAGLQVIETEGWKTRGVRGLGLQSVEGVTVHHTASGRGTGSTLGLNTIINGRPGLSGPLAQLYVNRAGVFYVVAAGYCNHAGASQERLQANSYRIGIEALAAGDGWSQDWPPVQIAAMMLACSALAKHYRFPVSEVLGHKETCHPRGRKIDPSFDMDSFRDGTRHAVHSSDDRKETMSFSDKHKLTQADEDAFANPETKKGEFKTFGELVRFPPATARVRREQREQSDKILKASAEQHRAVLESIKTLTAAVDRLTAALQKPKE